MERDRDLDPTALAALAGRFGGRVVLTGDPDYDHARVVWNAIFDRYPACIAQCASVPDVLAAVRFAREQELTIAVRGGGHSAAGFSTCDGGMGRLQRKYGLTIDNLLGVNLVTADGRLVRADENENPELFWGLRGAGANFGIVTSFHFRLHPVGPAVVQGVVVYPLEQAHDLAGRFFELAAASPDELMMSLEFRIATDYPPYPNGMAGRPIVLNEVTYCGPVDRSDRYLRPLIAANPIVNTVQPRSYLAVQTRKDEMLTWGHRFYMKNAFFLAITDEIVDLCAARLCEAPGACSVGFMTQGGAVARVPAEATAFTGREAAFWCGVETVWDDPGLDDAHIGWGRATMAALKPFTGHGHYVNDVVESGEDAVRDIYGDAKYERLVALKRAWDPGNVFRLNHNILPARPDVL